MRWWAFILIGLICYLIFLAANLPARHAMAWLKPANLPVEMRGVTGTVWSGQASQAIYKQNNLGAADWRFAPLGLLQGRLQYRFALRDRGQEVKGLVSTNPFNGQYRLSEVNGLVGMESLMQLLERPYVDAEGKVDLELRQVDFTSQQVMFADGRVRWLDAGISSPMTLELGGLQLDLSGDEGALTGRIKDLDGPVKVNAELSLAPSGQYLVKGSVKPQGPDSQGLTGLLRTIGRPTADGSIQINYKGQL